MSAFVARSVAFVLLVWSCASAPAVEAQAIDTQAIVGLDHIPTVVPDLERAQDTYRRLGFSVKPGRAHANGLRNSHVKFEDGSGIELIAPPHEATDELTRDYRERLKHGEGPAYLSLHARDKQALIAALNAAEIAFEDGGVLTLSDPRLKFLFFVQDNRSPTDRPEHFAHANSANAMTGVWLALDEPASAALKRLLLALGAKHTHETAHAPGTVRADVFRVENGRIVVVRKRGATDDTRSIFGAEFRVRSIVETERRLRASKLGFERTGRSRIVRVKAGLAHGLRLEFHENP